MNFVDPVGHLFYLRARELRVRFVPVTRFYYLVRRFKHDSDNRGD
jgi:hypothetical protein